MYFALSSTFKVMKLQMFVRDTVTVSIASLAIVALGALVVNLRLPWMLGPRMLATIQISAVGLVTLFAAYPALVWTRCLSKEEVTTLMSIFRKKLYASA